MSTFTNNTVPGNEHAIVGVADKGIGVHGTSNTSTGTGGVSDSGIGVHGVSKAGPGVRGDAENGTGVFGGSKTSTAVGGISDSGIGVHGISQTADGVWGNSESGRGIVGVAKTATGVEGISTSGTGVWGSSATGEGVHGETKSSIVAAVAAFNLNPDGTGAAIYAEKKGNVGHAGFFKGNVHVTGNLTTDGDIVLTNADCAEDFDIADADSVEPGTVMVLGDNESLHRSCHPYDKRVAGVVSGAGEYKPGIVLDKQGTNSNRKPIALLGKVYCKVDAQYASIEVGDLLTTSPSPGHAMKASDHLQAFGAVIGKALRPLKEGQGLIPILIALQ